MVLIGQSYYEIVTENNEKKKKHETNVSENQFGFMLERSTNEVIDFFRRLIEKLREKKKDLCMVLTDLEKALDMIPTE